MAHESCHNGPGEIEESQAMRTTEWMSMHGHRNSIGFQFTDAIQAAECGDGVQDCVDRSRDRLASNPVLISVDVVVLRRDEAHNRLQLS